MVTQISLSFFLVRIHYRNTMPYGQSGVTLSDRGNCPEGLTEEAMGRSPFDHGQNSTQQVHQLPEHLVGRRQQLLQEMA
jgi:hypothetical protein